MFFNNGFWFYSMMGGWSTWQWVFLKSSINFWSFDTPGTPGCASAVFADNQSENEIWNRLKRFLPVCIGNAQLWFHTILNYANLFQSAPSCHHSISNRAEMGHNYYLCCAEFNALLSLTETIICSIYWSCNTDISK